MQSVISKVSRIGRLLVAAALVPLATLAQAQAGIGAPAPNPSATSVPLPIVDTRIRLFEDDAQRMTVPVTIGAGPPLSFLIDTGAERSGVSTDVANTLQLPQQRSVTVVGFAGRQLVPTVNLGGLSYDRAVRHSLEVLLFSRAVIGADGFLGIDALAGQSIDFDFINRRMQIRRSPKGSMFTSRDAIVVRASKQPGRLIFSNAEVDRVKAEVLLDTGSSLTIGNAALFERLRRKRRLGPTIPVQMMTITGDIINADYGILREVMVGDVLIRALPIAFATTEPFAQLGLTDRPAMLMGMDALRVFAAVTIDFKSRQVRFQPRDAYRANAEIRFQGLVM